MHGFTYDEIHDEFTVPQQFAQAILTFAGGASGEAAPLRIIRSGPLKEASLGIGNPHPVAYDSKREQILVPN